MLLSGVWFETIAAVLLAILVLATGYRPPWWFWSRNYNANAGKYDSPISPFFYLIFQHPRSTNGTAYDFHSPRLLFLSFYRMLHLSS